MDPTQLAFGTLIVAAFVAIATPISTAIVTYMNNRRADRAQKADHAQQLELARVTSRTEIYDDPRKTVQLLCINLLDTATSHLDAMEDVQLIPKWNTKTKPIRDRVVRLELEMITAMNRMRVYKPEVYDAAVEYLDISRKALGRTINGLRRNRPLKELMIDESREARESLEKLAETVRRTIESDAS